MITVRSKLPLQTWKFEIQPEDGFVRLSPSNLLRDIEGLHTAVWSHEEVRAFLDQKRELLVSCFEGVLRFRVLAFGLVSVIRDRQQPGGAVQICQEMGPRLFFFELRDAAGLNPAVLAGGKA